jgi:hypothetical protein
MSTMYKEDGPPLSIDHHDITEILLKVVLSTIILTLSLIHKQTLKEEY